MKLPQPFRTNEQIREVFRKYFPRIAEGTVEIVSLNRIVGRRCLLVVRSRDPKVSALRARSFERGERLKALVTELGGESPTLVQWQASPEKLIKAALLPAEVALDSNLRQARVTLHPMSQNRPMVNGEDQMVRATSEVASLVSERTGWQIILANP